MTRRKPSMMTNSSGVATVGDSVPWSRGDNGGFGRTYQRIYFVCLKILLLVSVFNSNQFVNSKFLFFPWVQTIAIPNNEINYNC